MLMTRLEAAAAAVGLSLTAAARPSLLFSWSSWVAAAARRASYSASSSCAEGGTKRLKDRSQGGPAVAPGAMCTGRQRSAAAVSEPCLTCPSPLPSPLGRTAGKGEPAHLLELLVLTVAAAAAQHRRDHDGQHLRRQQAQQPPAPIDDDVVQVVPGDVGGESGEGSTCARPALWEDEMNGVRSHPPTDTGDDAAPAIMEPSPAAVVHLGQHPHAPPLT